MYECKARGKFRNDNIVPVVGDYCVIDGENNYILQKICKVGTPTKETDNSIKISISEFNTSGNYTPSASNGTSQFTVNDGSSDAEKTLTLSSDKIQQACDIVVEIKKDDKVCAQCRLDLPN